MDYYKLYVTVRVQVDKKRCSMLWATSHLTWGLLHVKPWKHSIGGEKEIANFILRQLENPDVKPVGRVGHYEERPQREEGLLSGRLDRWTGEWK